MQQVVHTIIRMQKNLVLVMKFGFARFNMLNLITPSGVLYTDGCQCDNCDCKG